MWTCVSIILLLGVLAHGQEEWREVHITQGPLRGRIAPEGDVYSFLSIPYATTPKGVDKFKAPLPAPTWTEMFDAVESIVCPQPTTVMQHMVSEDCLVANVHVPDTDETNLPVLVHIHGGAYQNSYGGTYTFNALVRTKKVIVVTFNYRLGVHGFLCLRTENAPGNAGIKDQIALLRWVNANIASFGGNPDDVTISACSAGSGSVDLLTLSGATTGLFNKAILESGNSMGAVGVQIDPIADAKYYATLLNFADVDDLKSLEEFYTTASWEQLFERTDAITFNENSNILFAPCLEVDLGQEMVISDTPMNIILNGNYTKVPMLYGFTNYDAISRMNLLGTWQDRMNEKFSDFLPEELHFDSEDEKEMVAAKVKSFYFQDQPVSMETIESYMYYFTDTLFAYPMLWELKSRVESLGDTIYLFEYNFVDSNTGGILGTEHKGATHCSQLNSVVDERTDTATDEYIQMKSITREYWLNFISTGNPWAEGSALPSWPPASARRSPHMSLGQVIELKDIPNEERTAFWDEIYAQYYGGPILPDQDQDNGAASLVTSYAIVIVFLLNLVL